MLCAICFISDQSKVLSSGNGLKCDLDFEPSYTNVCNETSTHQKELYS